MKKTMLIAVAAGGLVLLGAAPPPGPSAPREVKTGYPPCSRTVTDNCIQLYERGVRTADNLARNAAPGAAPVATAHAGHAATAAQPARRVTLASRGDRSKARRIRRAGERG